MFMYYIKNLGSFILWNSALSFCEGKWRRVDNDFNTASASKSSGSTSHDLSGSVELVHAWSQRERSRNGSLTRTATRYHVFMSDHWNRFNWGYTNLNSVLIWIKWRFNVINTTLQSESKEPTERTYSNSDFLKFISPILSFKRF